jgi:signal transduction histidine kinase
MTTRPAPHRARRNSVRARIAIACAGLFLILGGALIGATYGLIAHLSAPTSFGKASIVGNRAIRHVVEVATSAQASSDRREFLIYSITGLVLATLLAGGLGWAISGRVLRPLRVITDAARRASLENLHQRLALTGPPDELKDLADTFDAMLARLDGAFASQRRFVANASHELRTPLTEMRTLIDVTLATPGRSASPDDPMLIAVRNAVDRSEELIEALLTLSRSDRGLESTEIVDLPTAVEDAIDLVGPAAAARRITIRTDLSPAQVTGDRVLLERLASNLIDNAVRHNVTGGWILASTRHDASTAELTVSNGGEPIPADQVTGLFEPFHRLAARTGNRPGTGLGLSIVASVATAHSGWTDATARPDGGLEVTIRLPVTRQDNTQPSLVPAHSSSA